MAWAEPCMNSGVSPRDPSGVRTLEIVSEAPRYNAWMYETIAPSVGRRILEVGSGIGNMSEQLLRGTPEHLVLTDIDPWYQEQVRTRFGSRPEVRVDGLELPDRSAAARFGADRIDTVVALNVVEHIEDDVDAVRSMAEIVTPGGRVVILVPAIQALYGEMDRELGHFRRYSKRGLASVITAAGLRVERLTWFSRFSVLGWWFNGRVRRQRFIPVGQLRLLDAMVPVLRMERFLPLPFGLSLIAVGTRP
jgi:SAM-dependent methyltransferase